MFARSDGHAEPKTFDYLTWMAAVRRSTPVVPAPPVVRPRISSRRPAAKPPVDPMSTWQTIRFATSGSVRKIHDWLDAHCEGRWHMVVTGVDRYITTKFGRIHFECVADRRRFKEMYAMAYATAPATQRTPSRRMAA